MFQEKFSTDLLPVTLLPRICTKIFTMHLMIISSHKLHFTQLCEELKVAFLYLC